MAKPGEKGKCLNCTNMFCQSGTAWCTAKQMRKIAKTPYSSYDMERIREFRGAITAVNNERKEKTLKKLQDIVNPSWCPLRKEE